MIRNRFLVKKIKIHFFDTRRQKSGQKNHFSVKKIDDFLSVKKIGEKKIVTREKLMIFRSKNGDLFEKS